MRNELVQQKGPEHRASVQMCGTPVRSQMKRSYIATKEEDCEQCHLSVA